MTVAAMAEVPAKAGTSRAIRYTEAEKRAIVERFYAARLTGMPYTEALAAVGRTRDNSLLDWMRRYAPGYFTDPRLTHSKRTKPDRAARAKAEARAVGVVLRKHQLERIRLGIATVEQEIAATLATRKLQAGIDHVYGSALTKGGPKGNTAIVRIDPIVRALGKLKPFISPADAAAQMHPGHWAVWHEHWEWMEAFIVALRARADG